MVPCRLSDGGAHGKSEKGSSESSEEEKGRCEEAGKKISRAKEREPCADGEKKAGPKAGSKSSKEKVCCQETGNDKTGRKTRRTGYAGGGSGRAASDRHPGRLAVPHGGQALATAATGRLRGSSSTPAREALARVRAVTIQEPTHGRNNRNRYAASQHTGWRSVPGSYRPGTQAIQRDACRDGPLEGGSSWRSRA